MRPFRVSHRLEQPQKPNAARRARSDREGEVARGHAPQGSSSATWARSCDHVVSDLPRRLRQKRMG
jgi:hypothetical protein